MDEKVWKVKQRLRGKTTPEMMWDLTEKELRRKKCQLHRCEAEPGIHIVALKIAHREGFAVGALEEGPEIQIISPMFPGRGFREFPTWDRARDHLRDLLRPYM